MSNEPPVGGSSRRPHHILSGDVYQPAWWHRHSPWFRYCLALSGAKRGLDDVLSGVRSYSSRSLAIIVIRSVFFDAFLNRLYLFPLFGAHSVPVTSVVNAL